MKKCLGALARLLLPLSLPLSLTFAKFRTPSP